MASKNKKNFSEETIYEIIERDSPRGIPTCQACGVGFGCFEAIPHHVFFKSQLYRDCVSWSENGVLIHMECHRIIHHVGGELAKEYDRNLKYQAINRFKKVAGEKLSQDDFNELIRIYRSRGYGSVV